MGGAGAAALKGLGGGEVLPSRALGESLVESRFEALRRGQAVPLVGREEELELLLRRWRRARDGEGQVVLLRGEAGIGKSRLAAALREALAASGEVHLEVTFSSSPQHRDSALRPVVARLERAAGLLPADPPEARLAKLERLLLPLAPPPEHVALVAELLAVPTFGRWPSPGLPPQRQREALLAALLGRMRGLAARRPLLVLMEDAHWLDPTTLRIPRPGGRRGAGDGGAGRHHPPAGIRGRCLARPAACDAGAGQPAEPRRACRAAAPRRPRQAAAARGGGGDPARTDGVPLFVEELGRAVLEGALLREEADRWVLEAPLPRLAVPAQPAGLADGAARPLRREAGGGAGRRGAGAGIRA